MRKASFFSLFFIKQIVRFVALVATYALTLGICFFFALLLRFDFDVPTEFKMRFWRLLPWVLALKLIFLGFMGQYRSLLTFFSFPDAKKLVLALGMASCLLGVLWLLSKGVLLVPRGVIVVDFVLSTVALVSLRFGMRTFRERLNSNGPSLDQSRKRVAIIGAGLAGATLAREIQSKPGLGLSLICFVDDDPLKAGQTLHGREVVGNRTQLKDIVQRLDIQKVILAMPNAKPGVIQTTINTINELGLDHDILPSMAQLLHRQVTVSHLRRVDPEDLLGRDAVALDNAGIADLLKDKVVMVTGAGGSIGSELCRQIAAQNPAKLVLVERSEPALFAIEQELTASHRHVPLLPRATSVCDEDSLARLMETHRPALIFHAAAHKHVPLMEQQPAEALRNNAIGTAIVARLAGKFGAEKFVLVSSDKAVNPANIMGATKRLAELLVDESHRHGGSGCSYCAVRFGNVLGSSGSVVPIFRRQISQGGPVTVTHPEVTRYFMSIPEAVGLILQSALLSRGGEIFVLDMGSPVKIADLARQMVELCGFKPDEDIKITYTGLRPGEKLYEEPIHEMEDVGPTSHPKVRRLGSERANGNGGLAAELAVFYKESASDSDRIRRWLCEKVPEYRSG
jgi:FlaA1/EpsC-like NDP-sugar epimerase